MSNIVVRPYPSRPSTPWQVDIPKSMAGRRIRKFFSSPTAAWQWAMEKQEQTKEQGYAAFLNVHSPLGATLDDVIAQYRVRRGRDAVKQDRIEKGCLDALSKKFGKMAMDAVPATALETWIWSQGSTETTKAKYFRYVRALWNWSLKKGLVKQNVPLAVDAPSADCATHIFTPAKMVAALRLSANVPWMRAFLVLGGFGGIRTEEALKLRWKDVKFSDDQIHIPLGIAKESGGWGQRYVDFTEPMKAEAKAVWRARAKKEKPDGLIMDVLYGTFRKARTQLAKDIGLREWPRNCLRHSFASYHLAECGNAASTAYQMGHTSPSMVMSQYAQAVAKSDARAWWKIKPRP